MTGLRFDDVHVRYGRGRRAVDAVRGITLDVPDGSVVGVVGESGSGKSTLARTAVGLAPLSRGAVLLDGRPVESWHVRGQARPVQMVFQDPYSSLDPRMSVGASIAEAMIGERDRARRRAETERLLDLVGLDPGRASAKPAALSGGQRQRVALARALAAQPRVIIADEITSALDVSVQGAVLNLVRRLTQELGLTIVFISHNLAVTRYLADRIAVVRDGELVEEGPTLQVLHDPATDYTRALLDAVPRLP
ncbi:MAG: ATP-binding cassette domain-containing protein [Actinobacteria bacterium]|uniref:Unannotated protein n=1 Tax=freshwater metagenome TaxID=449393 RepID=A0A6J6PTJ0_9ZZZZ|nr:ATP-binding cassette domain-containing protein [Actinomycetota bacterium]